MEDQFPSPHGPRSQTGFLGDARHVKPSQVADSIALFADKMVMALDVTFKTCGVPGDADFADQSGASQGMQPVVHRGPRSLRIHPV